MTVGIQGSELLYETKANTENQAAYKRIEATLKDHGIVLSIGTDFVEYKRIVETERPTQNIGVPFNPDLVNLPCDQCFWLIGRSDDGALVHTQASKMLTMQDQSLAQYMNKEFQSFPPALSDIDFDRSRFHATPGAHRIKGRVAYHGEIWLAPEQKAYRDRGLAPMLVRACIAHIVDCWDPDWAFGLMARVLAEKGFADQIGYFHNEPAAVRWFREGGSRPVEGFLSYLHREDIAYLLSLPLAR